MTSLTTAIHTGKSCQTIHRKKFYLNTKHPNTFHSKQSTHSDILSDTFHLRQFIWTIHPRNFHVKHFIRGNLYSIIWTAAFHPKTFNPRYITADNSFQDISSVQFILNNLFQSILSKTFHPRLPRHFIRGDSSKIIHFRKFYSEQFILNISFEAIHP